MAKDNKLLALARFDLKHLLFHQNEDARGVDCGKIRTVFLQPVECGHTCKNCGCIFGKFDIFMWAGSDKELHEWLPHNVVEVANHKISLPKEKYFTGKLYVHQSKIIPGQATTGLCDAQLMVFNENQVVKTKVID